MPKLPVWEREQLAACRTELWSRGSRWKPAVWLAVDEQGVRRVVKDCSHLRGFRGWVARRLLKRELAILGRIQGLPGMPTLLEVVDADAFTMAPSQGEPMTEEAFRQAPRALADQLLSLASAMHARGVFHLDLRQRQNLLVDADGQMAVIDFGASWAPNPLARALFGRLLASVDRSAAWKYLARFAPEELSLAEAEELLRGLRRRKLWVVSPYKDRGVEEVLRQRIRTGSGK